MPRGPRGRKSKRWKTREIDGEMRERKSEMEMEERKRGREGER